MSVPNKPAASAPIAVPNASAAPAATSTGTPPTPSSLQSSLSSMSVSPSTSLTGQSGVMSPAPVPISRPSMFSEMWGHSPAPGSAAPVEDNYVPPYPLRELLPPGTRPAKSSVRSRVQSLPTQNVRFDLPEGTKAASDAVSNNEGLVVPAGTGFPTYSYAALELYQYYQAQCKRKGIQPWEKLLNQIKAASNSGQRLISLDLKGVVFSKRSAEIVGDILINATRIKNINLESSQLEDDMLKSVLEGALFHNRIEWMSLANNRRLKLTGIRYIADYVGKNPCLSFLDLSGLLLDKKTAQILTQGLATASPTLTTVFMHHCDLKPPVFEALAKGLKSVKVPFLSLKYNGLQVASSPSLYDLLVYNTHLKKLDLGNNDIRDVGAVNIGQALGRNTALETLLLCENNIGPTGLESIANGIRQNHALTHLDLSYNPLGDAQALGSLKSGLAVNRKLENLVLSNSNINNEGAIVIAEVLPETSTLRTINIEHNKIDIAGLMALWASMKLNKSVCLLAVTLTGQPTDEETKYMDEINFICTTNAAQVGAQFSAPASSEIVTEDGTNHGSPAQAPLSPAPPANLALSPARKPTTVSRTMSPPVAVSSSLLDRLREANDRAALLEDVMSGLPENHWETTQGELDLLKEMYQQCRSCLREFSNWTFSIGDPVVKQQVNKTIIYLTQVTVSYDATMPARIESVKNSVVVDGHHVEGEAAESSEDNHLETGSIDETIAPLSAPLPTLNSAKHNVTMDAEDTLTVPLSPSLTTSSSLGLHAGTSPPREIELKDNELQKVILQSAVEHPHRGSPPPDESAIHAVTNELEAGDEQLSSQKGNQQELFQ